MKPESGKEETAADNDNVRRNINSYYGHGMGFIQTLSLVLNAGLMVYAHVGLSAMIYSSLDPALTGSLGSLATGDGGGGSSETSGAVDLCNAQDLQLWTVFGEQNSQNASDYCARTYNGGCLTSIPCVEECFQAEGYSAPCSTCFGALGSCVINNLCFSCIIDSFGDECTACTAPCVEELVVCTGMPINNTDTNDGSDTTDKDDKDESDSPSPVPECDLSDIEVEQWYPAYNLTFTKSVKDAWTGDAELLAVIIIVFSGIWPYLKNIILVYVWYVPMTRKTQTSIILWLARLSKYTLVDVYAVMILAVGVQLQLDIAGIEIVIRAEPRFGIIAFFVATVWEFLQIELIKYMQERMISETETKETEEEEEEIISDEKAKLLFRQLVIPVWLLLVSIGLYVAGLLTEIVTVSVNDATTNTVSCFTPYDLIGIGNGLLNELSLSGNKVEEQTWTLYVIYMVLTLALPILAHLLQIIYVIYKCCSSAESSKSTTTSKRITEWAANVWNFSCVEVFLIGLFAVEFKFSELIATIAGEENEGFISVTSKLGTGFYILIAYSVVAGFLQYSIRVIERSMNGKVKGDSKK